MESLQKLACAHAFLSADAAGAAVVLTARDRKETGQNDGAQPCPADGAWHEATRVSEAMGDRYQRRQYPETNRGGKIDDVSIEANRARDLAFRAVIITSSSRELLLKDRACSAARQGFMPKCRDHRFCK
ncbi:hypothetical protein IF1G_00345 [Cordyceps javanica]|uniref:Uncharacterized protein n=1 Tax=Cordyceps javanica TaxID=43265 RepID=A0A545WC93_9HYPO|nr:hypothetical protein IF1G_00345 [Cordyceps javanica]TQW11599.1 hypothetical protein IF2G_00330 [Cordyceps javanica]